MPDTHVVTNQVPPLLDYNPATSPVLMEALIREGGGWGVDEVTELGALAGGARAAAGGDRRRRGDDRAGPGFGRGLGTRTTATPASSG